MRATSNLIASFGVLAVVSATPLEVRAGCEPQPAAASGAPQYSPDTAAAFSAQTSFGSIATAADVPAGYYQTYSNRNAATILQGMSFLGSVNLQTYDSNACAQRCNNLRGCTAINLYFERAPSLNPGSGCTNPASATQIKCAFFGDQARASSATNKGQFRAKFQVVIAGSNGYVNTTLATPSGYTDPTYLGKGAIVAPYDSQGYDSYMGITTFNSGAFDVARCADYCSSVSRMNLANAPTDGSPAQTCQFFNTWMQSLNKLGNRQVQQCQIYSESWPASYATNKGQYSGSDRFLVDYSYSFANSTNPGGPNKQGAIYQAKNEIVNNSLQPYCSSVFGPTTSTVTATDTATDAASSTSTSTFATVTAFSRREVGNVAGRDDAASSTPAVLSKYPATVVSSACALVTTPATSTI